MVATYVECSIASYMTLLASDLLATPQRPDRTSLRHPRIGNPCSVDAIGKIVRVSHAKVTHKGGVSRYHDGGKIC